VFLSLHPENRAHDAQLITKVNTYLADHDTDGLDIRFMKVTDATRFTTVPSLLKTSKSKHLLP